jgi:ABC-2 type transport system permease protein
MPAPGHRNVWLVMKHEFATTVSRRSFWLTTFLLPLAILTLSVGAQVFAQRSVATVTPSPVSPGQSVPAVGYVDESGLLLHLAPGAGDQALRRYPDEVSASAALRQGQLSEYYVIASDYLENGGLTLVTKERRPLTGANVSPLLTYVLNYNLTGNEQTARLLTNPVMQLDNTSLAPTQPGKASSDSLAFVVPYAALFILYLVLVMSGGFMLTSVAKEKQNRTAELLLVSLRARDLMLGKILGLAGVGLLQIVVWLGAGLVVLGQAHHLLATVGSYSLPSGFVPWTITYFLGGFLLYGALYAALGAMAATVREASQLMYVALLPLIVPLIVATTLIQEPPGGLAMTLSLFPLTSPVAMVTRLAAEAVPIWQILAGLVLLFVSAYGVVLVAARFFRVDNLLSSRAFSWRRLAQQFRFAEPKSR